MGKTACLEDSMHDNIIHADLRVWNLFLDYSLWSVLSKRPHVIQCAQQPVTSVDNLCYNSTSFEYQKIHHVSPILKIQSIYYWYLYRLLLKILRLWRVGYFLKYFFNKQNYLSIINCSIHVSPDKYWIRKHIHVKLLFCCLRSLSFSFKRIVLIFCKWNYL
jgi:hypothetical protein